MNGGAVDELVHGIEAQTVDVVVAHPHQRVVAEEAAHLVAARLLEVNRVAPRRVMPAIEVGAELAGVVAHRAEVVVDNVDEDCDASLMAGVDEALQAVGTAVRLVHGEELDAVVAPAELARKRCDRHQLNVRDAELREVIEPLRLQHRRCPRG